ILGQERHDVTATVVGDHLIDVEAGDRSGSMFGASIDIGTTTVVATLVDLASGAVASVASTINRQAPFGADVIARMGFAMQDEENVDRLREAVVETVDALLGEVCGEAGVDRAEVAEVVLVG